MNKLVAYVAQYGVMLVFANVVVEQIGIPIPAIPTLLVAGSLVRAGKLSFLALLAAAVAASLIVDTAWYFLGRRYGRRVLKTICRISLSPDSCVRQTESTFQKWGMASVVAARFITGFSTVAPPLAGAMGASLLTFLFYDSLGTVLWAGSGLLLGFVFHRAIEDVLGFLEGLGAGAVYVLGGALVLFVLFKWWQRRRFYRALRMARIGVDELRSLFEKGEKPVVVDVRGEGERERDPRRIPGAMTMDVSELDAKLPGIPPEVEIVLYCT
ncbi:MAG TPA: VTT domain-containing protein [Thermoanaerobaculia bacterium]|nr:VTT domain-containing protein [Thermoanaerobaculia bacterium]